jgi:UDP-N-acetylmuramate--alanine ligase
VSLADSNKTVHKKTYGIDQGQFFAEKLSTTGGFFSFDLIGFEKKIENIKLGVPGFHNVENAIAATIAAKAVGIEDAVIRKALESFKGAKRRFEFVYQRQNRIFIDDYAHHPTEIEAFLRSLKAMYPDKKVTVVFQPHLYTRTRDFAAGFAKSLSLADTLVMMDIYPARELPLPGVTSDMIFKDVTSPLKIRSSKKDLLSKLEGLDIDVLATVGAGDIDTFVKPIREMMIKKYEG